MLALTRIRIDQSSQEKEDFISKCPDEILTQIVSFLPTKEAVRTGTLSRRWESVWTCISTLELDCRKDFKFDNDGTEALYKFVEKALLDRKMPHLQNVIVRGADMLRRDIKSWISAVKERNMRVLDLNFPSNSDCIPEFPQSLISGCKLVEFRLNITTALNFPDALTSCFPNLKVLHLNSIYFMDDDSATNLISSCPVLEDFKISTHHEDCFTTLNVTSRSLKKFTLEFTVFEAEFDDVPKVIINAPAMESICIFDRAPHMYEMNEFSNLDTAIILIDRHGSPFSAEYRALRILELLKYMRNMKSLATSTGSMESLGGCYYRRLPIFSNLTSVDFCGYDNPYWEWNLLMAFLRNCPILEVLILQGLMFIGGDYGDDVPGCLISHLKTIKIFVLFNEYQECRIRYFLDNAQVLEKMMIEDAEDYAEILTFPRASPTCQIEIC